MDLWNAYHRAKLERAFGKDRLYLNARNRIDTSLATIEYSNRFIEPNQATAQRYGEFNRYISFRGITFDMLLTLYDVNSSTAMALRVSAKLGKAHADAMLRFCKARRANIEARIIGLQNGASVNEAMLENIQKFQESSPGSKLMEVDLFGNMTRHVALDTKSGMTYDLLLNNAINRPPDMVTQVKEGDFMKSAAETRFI